MDEAREFLQQQDLIEQIFKDVSALGYVGEREAVLLTYLTATSRKLTSPLAVSLQGPSSAGKSALITTIRDLMPDEEVMDLSRTTAQAFFYLGLQNPHLLQHKLVIIAEQQGGELANYPIRLLISEKKLTLMTVIGGEPIQVTVFGPIAFLQTTTAAVLNDETGNRMFELRLDASEEQTKVVLEIQRRAAATPPSYQDEAIVVRHQAAQRLLKPLEVVLPFAEHIRFPTHLTRFRRDQQKFLDLIKASAFLHQYQRRIVIGPGRRPYLEATLEDYDIAYPLMVRALHAAFEGLAPKAKELLDHIIKFTEMKEEGTFTRGDLVRWTGWGIHQLRNHLDDLVELGQVEVLTGSKGREYQYRLVHRPFEPRMPHELLLPSQLQERILEAGFQRELEALPT